MGGNGVEHMYAWQNVGGCIRPVNKAYQLDENVVPVKFQRTQKMSVRIDGGYDQKQSHAGIEECDIFSVILPVPEKEPDEHNSHIYEPE